MLSERLLITRLITSVGMALLLMLGVAAAAHPEPDGSAPVPVAVTAQLDPQVDSLSVETLSAVAEHVVVVAGQAGTSVLAGGALCILGVLCGLVFAVLTRTLWRRRTLPDRGARPRTFSSLPLPVVRPRAIGLSLTQLGLSRT